jgi:hypothetical protein
MTNIGQVGATPTSHDKIYSEIVSLCDDLAANSVTGRDIGIYAGSKQEISDRDAADHRLSAVVAALNHCTKP